MPCLCITQGFCFIIKVMKKIINIVEDEKDLNELVKSYLEKEGYMVNSYLTLIRLLPTSMIIVICGYSISCWTTNQALI